ncbi:MAG: VCBS repeat-containing protein, partial [Acidimicrobiales bacterium]|nr:VCBS repeat-containing protein [Acidimicrobiales bacterium]
MKLSPRRLVAAGTAVAIGLVFVATGASQQASAAPVEQTIYVTGTGPGGGPHVKVFSQNAAEQASFFAYGINFRGGVNVALGDINNDGVLEVITGAGAGGGPHVRVFTDHGAPLGPGFFAFAEGFSGGVNVTASDVNGDGDDEIIVAPASGGGPHVKIYDIVNNVPTVIGQFFAYSTAFLGGVSLTGLEATGGRTFAVAPGPGGGPHVKACNLAGCTNGFFAYASNYTGGVSLTNYSFEDGDVIVTGSMGSAGHIRAFGIDGSDDGLSFFAFPGTNKGVSLAGISDIDNPSTFLVAPFRGVGPAEGRDGEGSATPLTLNPYPGFGGGIRVDAEFGSFDATPPTTTTTTT